MSDPLRQLRALENGAATAQQSLEGKAAGADSAWKDKARRDFEKDHLGPIRADARRLREGLDEVAAALERARRELQQQGT